MVKFTALLISMTKTISRFIAKVQRYRITRLERRIGYKLVFPKISKPWINGIVSINLTKAWKKFGLKVIGVDYFTLGAIVNGISTRFDSKAPQYQSWLGGYLVKFESAKEWTIQDHFNLAVVDQTGWLHLYKDPNPICELHPSTFQKLGAVKIGDYPGQIYLGGCVTHSDVGLGNRSFLLRLDMIGMASIFNLKDPQLHLKGKNFIPKKDSHSYENIHLKGYIIIIDIKENIKAVLYGNGATFKNSEGQDVDTFELLHQQLLDTLMSTAIVKL